MEGSKLSKLYRHTEIIELSTQEDLDQLVTCLVQLKRDAPVSLRIRLAVTVERELEEVRPLHRLIGVPSKAIHPGVELRSVCKKIGVSAFSKSTLLEKKIDYVPPKNGVMRKSSVSLFSKRRASPSNRKA